MKDLDMAAIQNQRNKLRYEADSERTRSASVKYRKVRKEIKQKINTTKASFYKKILNSKNTKDIWKVIHHILNQKNITLEGNLNDVNKFLIAPPHAQREKNQLKHLTFTALLHRFQKAIRITNNKTTNSDEVLKITKSLVTIVQLDMTFSYS